MPLWATLSHDQYINSITNLISPKNPLSPSEIEFINAVADYAGASGNNINAANSAYKKLGVIFEQSKEVDDKRSIKNKLQERSSTVAYPEIKKKYIKSASPIYEFESNSNSNKEQERKPVINDLQKIK